MEREVLNINHEKTLLEYLRATLERGITTGVTDSQYYQYLNCVVRRINSDNSPFAKTAMYKKTKFSSIVEAAIKRVNGRVISSQRTYEVKDEYRVHRIHNEVIVPTYSLTDVDFNDCHFYWPGPQGQIKNLVLAESIETPDFSQYSLDKVSSQNFDVAKRIGAFFINDLIKRYVDSRIKAGFWPTQCRDVDEYIFNGDIAGGIKELGTKENFRKLYMHAIRVVAEMKQSTNGEIQFSNDKHNSLAYANYHHMVVPKSLPILKDYFYDPYKSDSTSVKVKTTAGIASFENSSCLFRNSSSIFSPEVASVGGFIGDHQVLTMEKRIGYIPKI